MLDWLKKLAGGSPSPDTGDLSEEQHGWLSQELAPLDAIRTGLQREAVRFVAAGSGEEVLAELVQHRGKASDLLWSEESRQPRDRLLESLQPGQARTAVRLARLHEATAREGRRSQEELPEGTPAWLDFLLLLSVGFTPNRSKQRSGKVGLAVIEEMLAAEGHARDLLVRVLLDLDPKTGFGSWTDRMLNGVPGWDQAFIRHAGLVRGALTQPEADRRVYVLELIAGSAADPEPFAAEIAELAASSAKTVREKAAILLAKVPAEALRRLLAEQKKGKVKAGIEAVLANKEGVSTGPENEFDLPPVPPVELNAPLTPELRRALEDWVQEVWEANKALTKTASPPAELVDAAAHLLQTMTWADPVPPGLRFLASHQRTPGNFLAHPGLKLVHVVRFLFFGATRDRKEWQRWKVIEWLGHYYTTHEPRFTLRELAAAFRALGLDESNVAEMILNRTPWITPVFYDLAPESVWPFFAERPEALEQALTATGPWAEERRRNALEVLALFPRLPRRLVPRIWDLALTGPKRDRPQVQECLSREPDRDEKLTAALEHSRAETRTGAAEWLGRLGNPAAAAPLKAALKKEKQEAAAGALMLALERLGVAPAEIVDFDGLLADSRKGLKKDLPAGLSWFGFEALPAVRWRESGEPVEPEVIRWLIVQSHKLGNPEPGTRLRYLATFFQPEDAEELGQHVLDAWIAQDALGYTHEEAHAHATQLAPQYVQWSRQMPNYFKPLTEEEYYRQLYTAKLVEPRGSAIKEKGVLAVAAACCAGRAAAPVERYLKRFYGQRAAHCKALLQMLAWVEHRSATQVLLATSARFRTASIRQEAERLVQALAERKGWTVDQLADRTIPTAGFDENCELLLDYGSRTFTAKLGEDWSAVLTNEEGKEIKALPDPRQGDDEEKAKEAKKALSAAKKEIKDILRLQKERLYEAMCTQRSWPFEDWDAFLNRHPVVRRYSQQLVWTVWDGEALTATFRPLEDGTLTDAEDNEVRPNPQAEVRLAHSCVVPQETADAWLRHFKDYEVQPLFPQLGGAWVLPEERRQETRVADFQGWLLEAFTLRGKATKLGWTRGPAEDGGVFSVYQKHFPGLGLTALLEFTGNSLPEQNRTVALTALSFHQDSSQAVPLGTVPVVLLSECRNDLAAIAAQGPGFDPDWEEKSNLW